MLNSLDPDQLYVLLGLIFVRISADDTRRQRVKYNLYTSPKNRISRNEVQVFQAKLGPACAIMESDLWRYYSVVFRVNVYTV